MKTKKHIADKIRSTIDVMDTAEPVKVSPFFKDKTMQRLFSEKEERQTMWSWFTPKLQLATLVCVVVLNIIAFTQLDTEVSESTVDTIDDFANSYELLESEELFVFN